MFAPRFESETGFVNVGLFNSKLGCFVDFKHIVDFNKAAHCSFDAKKLIFSKAQDAICSI